MSTGFGGIPDVRTFLELDSTKFVNTVQQLQAEVGAAISRGQAATSEVQARGLRGAIGARQRLPFALAAGPGFPPLRGETVVTTTLEGEEAIQRFNRDRASALRRATRLEQRHFNRLDTIRRRNEREEQAALNDKVRAARNAARLENRFQQRLASVRRRQVQEEQRILNDRRRAQAEGSQRFLGLAGIGTALTMPISGFTPLTIGFAGMAGPGFAAGAGAAVALRGIYDISRLVVRGFTRLVRGSLSLAESMELVTEKYKEQRAEIEATTGIFASFVGLGIESSLGRFSNALSENALLLSDLGFIVGRVAGDAIDFGMALGRAAEAGLPGGLRGAALMAITPFAPGTALRMARELDTNAQQERMSRLEELIRLNDTTKRAFMDPVAFGERFILGNQNKAAEQRDMIIRKLNEQLEEMRNQAMTPERVRTWFEFFTLPTAHAAAGTSRLLFE